MLKKKEFYFDFVLFFQECISIHIGQAGVQMGNACWYKDYMEYCQNTTHPQKSPQEDLILYNHSQGALLFGAWDPS